MNYDSSALESALCRFTETFGRGPMPSEISNLGDSIEPAKVQAGYVSIGQNINHSISCLRGTARPKMCLNNHAGAIQVQEIMKDTSFDCVAFLFFEFLFLLSFSQTTNPWPNQTWTEMNFRL
jgi:hypothetical protein